MTFDVFIKDLILVRQHIKKTIFEFFCIMAFVRFYLWTFNKLKIGVFQKSIQYFKKRVSGLLLCTHVRKRDLQLDFKFNGENAQVIDRKPL